MDSIVKVGKSIIQHGKYNDRIYLMKLDKGDLPSLLDKIDTLAEQKCYSKIFAKAPGSCRKLFCEYNYLCEVVIQQYYGKEDALFMSKFLSDARSVNTLNEIHEDVLKTALSKEGKQLSSISPEYTIRICDKNDVEQMADVYKKTFKTYPFPIQDPNYLLKVMEENIVFFGVFNEDKPLALSSAEMDIEHFGVEMTDFATLPEFRRDGFSSHLLAHMNKEMKKRGIRTAYTIARAKSYGMNIVFAKSGYTYCGMLVNNTNISGNIESMNVWSKNLEIDN